MSIHFEQYLLTCSFLFPPPIILRCPHKRETCTNRANHPYDVVYISNAEGM